MYSYIIVDDEPLIRQGTIKKLEPMKDKIYCVGEASNGQEGLELLSEKNPDIIITDMYMPGMNGEIFLPIIHEKYPLKPIIVISGYKDFDYAKQAIAANACSYILKPFSKIDICKAVQGAIDSLKQSLQSKEHLNILEEAQEYIKYDYDIQTLKSLILGYQPTVDGFTSERLQLLMNTHCLVLMTIYSVNSISTINVTSYIKENDINDLVIYLPHMHSDNIGFLLLFSPERTILQLESFLKQLSSTLMQYFADNNITISIGISSAKANPTQLNSAYKETTQALNSCTLADDKAYYFYRQSFEDVKLIDWFSIEEFLFRVESAEADSVTRLINDLFKYMKSIPKLTLNDAKNYSLYLIQQVRIILSNYIKFNADVPSHNIENIFQSIFSFQELNKFLSMFLTNISISLKNNNIYAVDDVIGKIQIYIQRNYNNNLNSEFIASLFYMNRSYLSHLFKEKTGEKFIDYVTKVRIEKSKELLTKTDKKMYQIAKAVGYDNTKYFFRIFKKQTHMTPEEYRQANPSL